MALKATYVIDNGDHDTGVAQLILHILHIIAIRKYHSIFGTGILILGLGKGRGISFARLSRRTRKQTDVPGPV